MMTQPPVRTPCDSAAASPSKPLVAYQESDTDKRLGDLASHHLVRNTAENSYEFSMDLRDLHATQVDMVVRKVR